MVKQRSQDRTIVVQNVSQIGVSYQDIPTPFSLNPFWCSLESYCLNTFCLIYIPFNVGIGEVAKTIHKW